jgi:LmbE family N-acetylglucosaminyl deacetylase
VNVEPRRPPAFDHRDVGTSAQVWREAPQWQALPRVGIPGHVRRLLVVAAHPDDETLAAGGLVALAGRAGLAVDVVVATDGAASHPDSPTHTREQLAVRRAREVTAAVHALAPAAQLHLLGLPDGDLAEHVALLAERVVDLVGTRGGETLLVATWQGDGHPDHEAAGAAARTAAWRTDATLWQSPLWLWSWGGPEDLPWETAHLVPLPADVVRLKTEAVAQHLSQVAPLSERPGDETLLAPAFLEHFRGDAELHLEVAPDRSSPFDALHLALPDPWEVRSSWYERRKRAVTLASLPHERYDRAIDVGCSVGELSAELAARCGWLLAVDESAVAVRQAHHHLIVHRGVEVSRLDLPEEWPQRSLDLVVVSETGYFLSPARLDALIGCIRRSLAPGGVVLACHWRHEIRGWPLDGPQVHERLHAGLALRRVVQHDDEDFELAVWQDDREDG